MLQRVLAEGRWRERMTEADVRGLTPLVWGHVSPYGAFDLDMEQRLDLELREAACYQHPQPFCTMATIPCAALSSSRVGLGNHSDHRSAEFGAPRGNPGRARKTRIMRIDSIEIPVSAGP